MRQTAGLPPAVAELVERRRRAFGPTSMLFYERPLNLVRGEGVWLYDADGSRYLDAYNNVPSVGHCHPRVVEAVSRQLATLNTHTRYLYDIVYTYAEQLLATMPREVSNIVFTCTGSESVDLALRIARALTGGSRLHRHRERLPRQHDDRDRGLAVLGEHRAAKRSRLHHSCARYVSRRKQSAWASVSPPT